MLADLKFALRQLAKNPGFTAFAVLALAVGIGINTSLFAAIDAVMFRALPVRNRHELVFLTNPELHGFRTGVQQGPRGMLTYAEFRYLHDHDAVFSGLCAVEAQAQRIPARAPESRDGDGRARVRLVSGDYFAVLGVDSFLGHPFGPEVDQGRDAHPVAAVSYDYWRDSLGADPAVIGKKVRLRAALFEIVAVMAPQFHGETVGSDTDLWVPLTMQSEVLPLVDNLSQETDPLRKKQWLQVIALAKPGFSLAGAGSGVEVEFQRYLQSQLGPAAPDAFRKNFLNQHLVLTRGDRGGSVLRAPYGDPLVLLMGLVGLLLLAACANVATLLLARSAMRRREIAIRAALGANSGRIFRQLLTESVLLAGLGGAVGLVVAHWGNAALPRLVGASLDIRLNGPVLGFTLGVSLLVGLLFGVAPAWQACRADPADSLRGGAGVAVAGRRISLGKILVSAQVALSILLGATAGLFVHSFQKLEAVDLGFDRTHLLTFGVDPGAAGVRGAAFVQLCQELGDGIREVPGVRGVSYAGNGLLGGGDISLPVSVEGQPARTNNPMTAAVDDVSPGYFSTVGIPVLLGRPLSPQDQGLLPHPCVINRTMARSLFGDADPLGRRLRDEFTPVHAEFTVVGVVADIKYHSLREAPMNRLYYLAYDAPFWDPSGTPAANFEVRTDADPSAVAAAVAAAIHGVAPRLPPVQSTPMDQLVDRALNSDKLLLKLSGFFGALAAGLAAAGIYGIMSFLVARRTPELGVRMALGARPADLLWLILRESLLFVLIGAAIGLPAAAGVEYLLGSRLYGLSPADPAALAGALGVMLLAALAAGHLPARRAARVDPMVALRAE